MNVELVNGIRDDSIAAEISSASEGVAPYASKKLAVFALAGLSVLFLVSAFFKPSTGEYFTICGFKNLTGLPCPGCGLTHSFCALTQGDIAGAFAFNLLGPLLYLALIVLWIRSMCVLLDRTEMVRHYDEFAARFSLVRMYAIAFAVYGIVRIAYLLMFDPLPQSPLSKFVASIMQ
ncbi:MAG TPA: DUF2752 domain-containing protein [Blastocatellia bacterium]|nr:DUF2752 domain-containing protein [Blastocatellia bacterium]